MDLDVIPIKREGTMFIAQVVTQADLDRIGKVLKPILLRSTAVYMCLPPLTPKQVHNIHMNAGFELGLLEVIDDEAYKRATKRQRSIVVYRDKAYEATENLK